MKNKQQEILIFGEKMVGFGVGRDSFGDLCVSFSRLPEPCPGIVKEEDLIGNEVVSFVFRDKEGLNILINILKKCRKFVNKQKIIAYDLKFEVKSDE
ncbi:MAG: hypothetical protein OEV78_12970 [Spirochaetia bacterium]|nr:hypothetical protein [Spirochaetia bacterium]